MMDRKVKMLSLLLISAFMLTEFMLIEGVAQRVSHASMPPHDEIMRQLQAEAKAKHVYYYVWCTAYFEGDKEEYMALASVGSAMNIYAEDGAKPYWSTVSTYSSQDRAAWALVQALKSPPNRQPQHKSKPKDHACIPPIEGGPQP